MALKMSKNLLGVIAGQASIVTILVLVLLLSIVGAPLLQQKKVVAQRLGADVAVTKAFAITEAILAGEAGRESLDTYASSFSASHLQHSLAPNAAHQPAGTPAAGAAAWLRENAGRPYIHFETVAGNPHLFYGVRDRADGLLLLDLSLERERATIGRFFGQSYLSMNAVGYFLMALLLFGAFSLRYYLRSIIKMPEEERRDTIIDGLRGDLHSRRNLLPWLLVMCAAIFAVDITNMLDSAIGIGYLLAVVLALSSSRHWHITLVATISALLMLIAPMLSPYDGNWWSYLESHSVSVFAIFATGFFGSANMRKSQAEALALAEAVRSRAETADLREALERAEAAEAQNRRMVERIRMANDAAGLSVWEWDIKEDITRIDENSPFLERLGAPREFRGTDYTEKYVHPDDREGWVAHFTKVLTGTDQIVLVPLPRAVRRRHRRLHPVSRARAAQCQGPPGERAGHRLGRDATRNWRSRRSRASRATCARRRSASSALSRARRTRCSSSTCAPARRGTRRASARCSVTRPRTATPTARSRRSSIPTTARSSARRWATT